MRPPQPSPAAARASRCTARPAAPRSRTTCFAALLSTAPGSRAGHVAQYEDTAIGNSEQPGITVHDAIEALATVHAVYIASALQRPVKFVDVLEGRYDDDASRGIGLPPA